jgi:hypothetical protein
MFGLGIGCLGGMVVSGGTVVKTIPWLGAWVWLGKVNVRLSGVDSV